MRRTTVDPIDTCSSRNYICSCHISCPCKHYIVLSSFITRRRVGIWCRDRWTLYGVWDTGAVKEVKEKKSEEEGVDVDDMDIVLQGRRLDEDQQWWQAGVFDYAYFDMYKK